MRKTMKFAAILTAAVISLSAAFYAGDIKNVTAAAQTPIVKLDGKPVSFPDAKPYVNEDNRTMVPVRFVTEALGCNVKWEEADQLVIISKDPKRILFQIGQNWAIVNDQKTDIRKEFDTKAVLKEERTMVPLRFISETLGAGVAWDEVNNTVLIRSDGIVEAVATPTPGPTPTPTPVSWVNVEVPMTLVEGDPMPEGFIKPQFVVKHVPLGQAEYFSIDLKNIEAYKNTAEDYAYKITCLNHDLINWTTGIPDIKRMDNVRNLSTEFAYKYVTPVLWGAPSKDHQFNNHPELGKVEIHPGVILEMQVEFYYAGLKQTYRDNVQIKPR
mgnify:CR=1 FL=1